MALFESARRHFVINWADNEDPSDFTGLTLHATAMDQADAALTLLGYTIADLRHRRRSD